MIFKPKLWLSVGTVALAGAAGVRADSSIPYLSAADKRAAKPTGASTPTVIAQLQGYDGESGERGEGGERRHRSGREIRPAGRGEAGEQRASHVYMHGGEADERGVPGYTHGGEKGEAGVNTRYIFGFTEGADTEPQGEREFENDTVASFGKRSGTYTAVQNETELELGITDNLMVEFGAFGSYHRIRDVPDLEDRNNGRFDGLAAELKYRLLDRSIHPFGFAISVEPEWRRSSGNSGSPENSYELELKAYVDRELVPGRLYWAANIGYEPEVVRAEELGPAGGAVVKWEHESSLDISTAISGRITPNVFLGAELRYVSAYEGLGLDTLEGPAVYIGPTLSARLAPNALIQVAYSRQIAGRSVDEPNQNLDLHNFDKQQVRFRFVAEF